MIDENLESSNTLPVLHLIFSVGERIDIRQISLKEIPILTVVYDGNNVLAIEGEEHLKKVLDESLQNLLQNQDADFYKDLSIAIRFRRVVANSNSV